MKLTFTRVHQVQISINDDRTPEEQPMLKPLGHQKCFWFNRTYRLKTRGRLGHIFHEDSGRESENVEIGSIYVLRRVKKQQKYVA